MVKTGLNMGDQKGAKKCGTHMWAWGSKMGLQIRIRYWGFERLTQVYREKNIYN
jgi:hypothetical protein